MTFDPNAAATCDGLYGLPTSVEEARVVVIPVPFDATTSYRDGTRNGPAAVLEASWQVDLHDVDFGDPYRKGIAMLPLDGGVVRKIRSLNDEARRHSKPVIAAGGEIDGSPRLRKALDQANRLCARMNDLVEETAAALISKGKLAVVLGGDHSTPFGSIKACAAKHPGLGILHIDAHADLRVAYEGFQWSHASIMHNVASKIGARGGVATLVQVGIRDLCEAEHDLIRRRTGSGETRIVTFFDSHLQAAKMRGTPWATLAKKVVGRLPKKVYVSFDIDGLDPALCPDTGTPVAGGLSFAEMVELLRAVRAAGKTIVGFDLNEVAPNRLLPARDWGMDWNANVGARALYKLIGAATSPARR